MSSYDWSIGEITAVSDNEVDDSSADGKATIRDNWVDFKRNNDFTLSDASFSTTGYSITSGQPWGGVYSSTGGAELLARAGRKKSSGVASWFNAEASGGYKLANGTFATSPSELNFAFKGKLILYTSIGVIDCPNVVLAQGNHSSTNNWWMTAPGMQLHHESATFRIAKLQCTLNGSSKTIYFRTEIVTINSFGVNSTGG